VDKVKSSQVAFNMWKWQTHKLLKSVPHGQCDARPAEKRLLSLSLCILCYFIFNVYYIYPCKSNENFWKNKHAYSPLRQKYKYNITTEWTCPQSSSPTPNNKHQPHCSSVRPAVANAKPPNWTITTCRQTKVQPSSTVLHHYISVTVLLTFLFQKFL